MILIYQDYVHNNGSLYKLLCEMYGRDQIAYADADAIKNDILTPQVKAFFMPGGATRYVADKLKGVGNKKIRAYVAMGGLYIGICAGAYYGCRRTEWRKGQADEICVDNELAFFPGIALGPIPGFAEADIATISDQNDQHYSSFYWSGPLFEGSFDDVTLLANYQTLPGQPPAIITGHSGKGRYILSSPHLEIDSQQLDLMCFNVSNNRFAEISDMTDISGITVAFFKTLLRKFIV